MIDQPIFYAEDDENDAFLLRHAFKLAGITNPLVVVQDGNAAVEYFQARNAVTNGRSAGLPLIALLDLKMPGKSGLDVLKWIRATPSLCTLPVVILTSSSNDSDMQRAYQQGANSYLVKPSNPEELLKMARSIKDYWLSTNRLPATDATKDRTPPA